MTAHLQAPVAPRSDLVVGDDGLARPSWAAHDPALRLYYDTEWGVPVTDERGLFELLALECFMSGFSWQLVLRRREGFRTAFAGFDPDVIAGYDESDVVRLLADPGIVRNRHRIEAVIANARATVAVRGDGGLVELVWHEMPTVTPVPQTIDDVPLQSEESVRLADQLRNRGFRRVGPVTMQGLMAAAGVVDCHLVGSHRRGCSGLWTKAGVRRRRPMLPG
jgi:DNA-3-methyladenine glycosylase I